MMQNEPEHARERQGRLPPQDLDAERSVLGGMLLEEGAVSEVMALLQLDDFYRMAHARIFSAMGTLYGRNEPIDEITVGSCLRENGQLEGVGGQAFLSSLTESVPTAANVVHYARIVRARALSRRLIAAATSIAQIGYDGGGDIDSVMDQAETKIFEITSTRQQRAFTPLKEIVKGAFRQIEKLYDQKTPITGVATGFAELDRVTAGFQPADLIIVAGRPSMGKTALALSMAHYAATENRVHVAVFSLEMAKEQLVMRLLCAEARIDSQRLRGGILTDSDWPKLARAAGVLAEAPVFIDDTGSISVLEMRAKCRRLQNEHGLGLIIVDYLQLMRGSGRGSEGREREISEISRGLKALAKELHVPVVALSQLNRSLEQRQEKRPMLSDLRESGAIEQDADVIAFVYRDEYYNAESEYRGLAEVIVGKQRNGPTATIMLKFFREYTRFEDVDRTEQLEKARKLAEQRAAPAHPATAGRAPSAAGTQRTPPPAATAVPASPSVPIPDVSPSAAATQPDPAQTNTAWLDPLQPLSQLQHAPSSELPLLPLPRPPEPEPIEDIFGEDDDPFAD